MTTEMMNRNELMENELNAVNGGAEEKTLFEKAGLSMEEIVRIIENSPNDAPEIMQRLKPDWLNEPVVLYTDLLKNA